MKFYDVIIIGAGPTGLMTALNIKNKSVLLIDANSNIGGKIKLSGGGRCNVSNNKEVNEFLKKVPKNEKFLLSTFSKFSPKDLIDFFNDNNVLLKEEDNGRMFPKSNNSDSIIDFFKENISNNVTTKLNYLVNDIFYEDSLFYIDDNFYSKKLVVCTGGISYPHISHSYKGHDLLETLNHTKTDFLPSETPLVVTNDLISSKVLQGTTLKNCLGELYLDNKKKISLTGDILFTHFGLSGPLALNFSFYVAKYLKESKEVKLKLYPSEIPKKIKNYLIDGSIELKISDVKGFKTAFLTNGGINLKEVNNKNFESKLIDNLFIAGEVLDINAFTGGYNIAICMCEGKIIGDFINEN